MKKYVKSSSLDNRYLSVFWYIDGVFVGPEDSVKGDSVELIGDYYQIDKDHFSEWTKVARHEGIDPNKVEYDYYPRGRIMYHTALHKFKVIGDPKIVDDPEIQKKLVEFYNLSSPKIVIFESDEHYTSEEDGKK